MARLRLPVTLAVVLILAPAGCTRRPVAEPTTLVLLDIGPTRNTDYSDWMERALVGFHRETGVAVKRVLAPESSDEQLVLERQLLEGGATTPDVYIIDAIWPGVLGEHFIDLRPRLAAEAALHFPALVANNVVQGRLVAMPYHANVGILYYRTDLLREYGYGAPPSTWTELEGMAAAIQKGERAKGHEGFWGYVWQGAPYEGLTCNALEWQESEGGGRIVEDDGTISVDNPRTVAAWSRAASWVGTISPPAVVGYREGDAQEVWRSGRAAFMRSWPYAGRDRGSSVRGRFDITTVPRGATRWSSARTRWPCRDTRSTSTRASRS
jgi:trehalose/maltose transport system substrate-binding protein